MRYLKSFLIVLAALPILVACSDTSTLNEQNVITRPETWSRISSDEEAQAIAGLLVYQRDLEALNNLYQNVDSKAVRARIITLREQELIRLAKEASTKRKKNAVKASLESYDSDKAQRTVREL